MPDLNKCLLCSCITGGAGVPSAPAGENIFMCISQQFMLFINLGFFYVSLLICNYRIMTSVDSYRYVELCVVGATPIQQPGGRPIFRLLEILNLHVIFRC